MTGGAPARRGRARPSATILCDGWPSDCSCGLNPASACRRSSVSRPPPPPALVAPASRRHRRPATSSSTCTAGAAGSPAPPSTASGKADQPGGHRRSTGSWPRSSSGRPTSATSTPRSRPWRRPPRRRVQPQVVDRRPLREPLRDLRPAASSLDEFIWAADAPRASDGRPHRPAAARAASTTAAPSAATSSAAASSARRRSTPTTCGLRRVDRDATRAAGVPPRPLPGPRGRRRARRRAARPPHAAPARRRSPRSSSGSRATSARRPIEAALRLVAPPRARCPASRLTTSPGRVAPLRIPGGQVKPPGRRPVARAQPVARVRGRRSRRSAASSSASRAAPAGRSRHGSATTCAASARASPRPCVKLGTPPAFRALELEAARLAEHRARPRVRLVLGHAAAPAQPRTGSPGPTTRRLGARPRGRGDCCRSSRCSGPAAAPPWGWQAAALGRSLAAVEPSWPATPAWCCCSRATARRPSSPAALGGVGAGFRLARRPAGRAGRRDAAASSSCPARVGRGPAAAPRTRANVALPPLAGRRRRPGHRAAAERPVRAAGTGRRRRRSRRRTRPGPWSTPRSRSSSCAASRPASSGLLGEILVGLDRAGHLRRLVRPRRHRPTDAAADASTATATRRRPSARPEPARRDHVERLLPSSATPCSRSDGRRLVRVGEDRWWLGDRARPGRGRGPARRPRRVGGLQPAVDRRARCRSPRSSTASRACSSGRDLPGRGPGPRLPRQLSQPRQHPGQPGHRRRPHPPEPTSTASSSPSSSSSATGWASRAGSAPAAAAQGRRLPLWRAPRRPRAGRPAVLRPDPRRGPRGRRRHLVRPRAHGVPVGGRVDGDARRHRRVATRGSRPTTASSGSSSCSPSARSWSATSSSARRCSAPSSRRGTGT